MADVADTSMSPASGGGGDALAQIFKHNDAAYYWSVKDLKAKKVRVDRYSTSQPGKIYIQGGGFMDSGGLFISREKAEEESSRQLASGSPFKKARLDDDAVPVSVDAASGAQDAAPGAQAEGLTEGPHPFTLLASALETKEAEAIAFARRTADWLDQLQSGNARGSLPVALAERFPLDATTRAKMLAAVPWDSNHGYTTMLRYPKTPKCKGVLHIASFDYSERGLHGRGLYAGVDAISWLRAGDA